MDAFCRRIYHLLHNLSLPIGIVHGCVDLTHHGKGGGGCYSFLKIKGPGIYKYIFQNSHKITYIFMILQNKINAVGIPRVKNVDVDKNN